MLSFITNNSSNISLLLIQNVIRSALCFLCMSFLFCKNVRDWCAVCGWAGGEQQLLTAFPLKTAENETIRAVRVNRNCEDVEKQWAETHVESSVRRSCRFSDCYQEVHHHQRRLSQHYYYKNINYSLFTAAQIILFILTVIWVSLCSSYQMFSLLSAHCFGFSANKNAFFFLYSCHLIIVISFRGFQVVWEDVCDLLLIPDKEKVKINTHDTEMNSACE